MGVFKIGPVLQVSYDYASQHLFIFIFLGTLQLTNANIHRKREIPIAEEGGFAKELH